MEDDWDLHAVVRSCTTTTSSVSFNNFPSTTDNNDDSLFLVDKPTILLNQELHQLCNPFITHHFQQRLLSPISVLGPLQDLPAPSQQQHLHQLSNMKLIQHKKPLPCTLHAQTPRNKRRKNQLKKVCQVAADGLSSDMWSWRKYGQKPIKGSPYPRGYYKCSTSKGCLARKQVERNRSDPNMFIVTYTGEHNHPMPTHRNSLAGISRQKRAKPTTSSPATNSPAPENEESSRDEKEEIFEEDDDFFDGLDKMEPDDDFFDGLDELEIPATGGSLPEKFPPTLQFPWLVNNAATTAAGGG